MVTKFRLVLILAVVALLAGAFTVYAAPPDKSTSPVLRFSDLSVVDGSSSTVRRTDTGASMTLRTSDLSPGDAVTIWWVIFNNPENCTDGCDEPDLFDPAVSASFGYAAGHVIGGSGKGNFAGHLAEGDTSNIVAGPGLMDARKAEIHLVVHTHGPKIPGMVDSQISTFLGGCRIDEWVGLLDALGITEEELPLRGEPGPNVCEDLQFSVHMPS